MATQMTVRRVGVKELKNKLTQYLRQTRAGEEVIVTDRGRPIAVIQPIESVERPRSLEAHLAKLAAQGRLTLPTRKLHKKAPKIKVSGLPLSRIVLEDRR